VQVEVTVHVASLFAAPVHGILFVEAEWLKLGLHKVLNFTLEIPSGTRARLRAL
jgi:hypothetical protein